MTPYQAPAFGLSTLKMRWNEATASFSVTGGAVRELTPVRRWNVYVLLPFEMTGMAVARSGTSLKFAAPATRWNASRPS